MVTVLEDCTTEQQRSVVRFFFFGGKRDSNAKDIHTEMFLVYSGKFLLCKAEVAETIVKRHLCCGFHRTGKAMGQVYNVGGGYVKK
jgi:hypothetical protein